MLPNAGQYWGRCFIFRDMHFESRDPVNDPSLPADASEEPDSGHRMHAEDAAVCIVELAEQTLGGAVPLLDCG